MYSLIPMSSDKKLGGIPGSYSPIGDCNPDCVLLTTKSCYALWGPVSIHWAKVSADERGVSWYAFIRQVAALPRRILWRHNIAGDLPRVGRTKRLDRRKLRQLTQANGNRKGFTYCHHEKSPDNLEAIREANEGGFTVNLSCDTALEAVATHKSTALPTVCTLPSNAPNVQTINGVRIIACPAEKSKVTCGPTCAHTMCANPKRDFIVGFRPHGVKKKAVDIIASAA